MAVGGEVGVEVYFWSLVSLRSGQQVSLVTGDWLMCNFLKKGKEKIIFQNGSYMINIFIKYQPLGIHQI